MGFDLTVVKCNMKLVYYKTSKLINNYMNDFKLLKILNNDQNQRKHFKTIYVLFLPDH